MGAIVGGIGPIAVRYAAQIRELLFSQAMKRMAAEEEAARAEAIAERAARIEALRARIQHVDAIREPVKIEPETARKAELAEPVKQAESTEPPAVPPAQIFNEQA